MHSHGKHGFTLVEVLAAGTILTVWGAVLAVSVRQSMRSLETADRTDTAAELLDEVLSKIDIIGPAAIDADGPKAGRFGPPYEAYAWQTEIVPLSDGDLYDITVTVSWLDQAGRTRRVAIETILNDPPDSRLAGIDWDSL